MTVREINAKSILRVQKKIDSWFVSRFGMNLYRGCAHNCAYCDGRAEKYQVEGEFGEEISVKINAIAVLERELNAKRRKPLKSGYFFVGGGVCDSYQPLELEYRLTRSALELLLERRLPVHLLTKSTHIERDLDLITELNAAKRAIVSMSFSSVDDRISAVFEPGVPPPSRRLQTLERCKSTGIAVGMYLLPVLPFITDSDEQLEASLDAARNVGVDFVVFGGMTLKGGRQQEHFIKVLQHFNPSMVARYQALYPGNSWGGAVPGYADALNRRLYNLALKYQLPVRIPPKLWLDLLDDNDRLVVFLEHIDYLLRLRGERSTFGRLANAVSQLAVPLSDMPTPERTLGFAKSTAKLIQELSTRGSAAYYEWLMYGKPLV